MDAMKDLKWLLLIIVALWFLWYFAGGRIHKASFEGPFIEAPAPLDSGDIYGPKI